VPVVVTRRVRRRRHRLCVRSPSCVRRAYHPGAAESDLLLLLCSSSSDCIIHALACSLGRAGPITIFSGRMLMQKGTLSTGTQRVKRGPARRRPPPQPPLVLSILARCLPQNSFFVTCRENWRAQSCFVRPSAFLLFY
jgi:hypothetical protein